MINWSLMRTPEGERREAARDDARGYLAETDWYVTRAADPSDGRAMPEDVAAGRAAARRVLREDEDADTPRT
jgi:hypothetical protein